MIEITNKKLCSGCSACEQICPKQCISMIEDSEGFLYPKVVTSKCVQCGLCEKVCPILNKMYSKEDTETSVETLVGYSSNLNLRKRSSSGGIFGELSRYVIQKGGIVAGAIFDDDFSVKHVLVHDLQELEKVFGSKYIQSRIENTFKETKFELEKGNFVLYSGTACQIAGLKSFLKRDYDNLITVDVLCHGVPTAKLWKQYLSEKYSSNELSIQSIEFRNKSEGWKQFGLLIEYDDQTILYQNHKENPFMRLFLSNICLRPSCHDCKFKKFPRVSDITIGDCWGIQNFMPDMDDDQGTSVILLNSQKGETLFSDISSKLKVKKAQLDVVLPPTADSRISVLPHRNRNKFFQLLKKECGMDRYMDKLKPPMLFRVKMKLSRLFNK